MRRIITSLLVVGVVGAVAIGATQAFFSDTETSTGNVFQSGAIDLTIDNVQHYNGMVCAEDVALSGIYNWVPDDEATLDEAQHPVMNPEFDAEAYNLLNPAQYPQAGVTCDGSWRLTDIGDNAFQAKFFNFLDVKPGDVGENTISFHIETNDAWMCAALGNIGGEDLEESRTEPEVEAGDSDTVSELPQNMQFFAWWDDGNNQYDVDEVAITQSPLSGDLVQDNVFTIADSTTGEPVVGGETHYIAVAWCAGTMTQPVAGSPITCDGAGMGNDAQTDSMTADVEFYVEQSRNNATFECAQDYVPSFEVPVLGEVSV